MSAQSILAECGFKDADEVRRVAAANSLPIEEPPVVRHLAEAAQPLHGRTYHDLRLAAAILDDFGDALPGISGNCVAAFLDHDPSLYHVEPEGER